MNRNEKELFFELCKFCQPNKDKIAKLIEDGGATPELLGMLFANRVAGIAHGVLNECGLLYKVDREFRMSLINASVINDKIIDDFYECVEYLTWILDSCGVPYALLKGAYLCCRYPKKYRTSNDIDILISPDDVGKISERLKTAGFCQGEMKNGEFVAANRKQIIESKMTRGETVPFIKPTNLLFVKNMEVDINFSLDYKNSDDKVLKKMLSRTQKIGLGVSHLRTLDNFDFILHLCAHLYKEATTMPWIKMKRDMTFYKYCDIYMMLSTFSEEEKKKLLERAREGGLETELAYCVKSIELFFGITCGIKSEDFVEIRDLDEVVAPKEKKIYRYTDTDMVKRFFAKDRTKLLVEDKNE